MELWEFPLNENMRELTRHGSSSFPIQYYVDEPSHFSNCTIPLHWHPELEFWVAYGGTAMIQVGKTSISLEEGSGIFINANVLHSFQQPDPEQKLQCPNIVFLDELIAPVTSRIYQKYIRPITTNCQFPYILLAPGCAWQNDILLLLHSIFSLFQTYGLGENDRKIAVLKFMNPVHDCSSYEMAVQNSLNKIWQILFSHIREIPLISSQKNEQLLQIRTQKMLSKIQSSYSQQITLTEIAASAGISKSEASRCFQSYLHTSPVNYLLSYRIERAKWALQNSMDTIEQISEHCGFQSTSYFGRIFRRQTGMSPSQYRKQPFS